MKSFVFICWAVIFSSCIYSSTTDEKTVITHANSDNCSYYENGQLAYIIPAADTGTAIWYYPNGQIQYAFRFKNDKYHGICKLYYESGQLKEIRNYDSSYPFGPFIGFYENGQPEFYAFFDEERSDTALYGKAYSQSGEFQGEFGFPFSLINIEEDEEKYWMSRIQPIEIISAIPPHTRVSFTIYLRKEGESSFVMGQNKTLDHDWHFIMNQYFPSKDKYDMMVIAQYSDTIRHDLKQDTIMLKNIWID